MTTATAARPSSAPAAIFAGRAEVNHEYITVKNANRVKVTKIEGERVTLLVKAAGYGYNTTPIQVDAKYLLRPIPGQPQGSPKAGKPASAQPTPRKEAPKAQAKAPAKAAEAKPKPKAAPSAKAPSIPDRKRLPKVVGKTPRIEIDGHNHRAHYRSILSKFKANECEKAEKDQCGCRCGGALHGKSHVAFMRWEQETFMKLKAPIPAKMVADYLRSLKGGKSGQKSAAKNS